MKTRLFVVSEAAVIDRKTNNLSVFNILEHLSVQGFPLVIPRLFIVASLDRGEKDENTTQLTLQVKQNHTTVFNQTLEFDFQDKETTRNLIELLGFTVTEPGFLLFRLNRNGRKFAEYVIFVHALPLPGPKKVTP